MTEELEPNVFLTDRCNQDCLFCSSVGEDRAQTPREISRCLAACEGSVSIEGGEPTLSKDLASVVRRSRKRGIRDIILCTNASALRGRRRVEELLAAGVTLFNINFPSHREKLFDLLTQTRGRFRGRVRVIRDLVRLAGGRRIRLTCVVNRLNFSTLPGYARFAHKNFPGTLYLEFNLVKVKGRVRERTYLVPRLKEVAPHLAETAAFMEERGARFIMDGFPLCAMRGFEHASIDVYKLTHGDELYLEEKGRTRRCAGCSLRRICAGPRRDYVALYGDAELKPSRKSPGRVISRQEAASSGPRSDL